MLVDLPGESEMRNRYGTRFLYVHDTDDNTNKYYCVTHDVICDSISGKCIICGQKVDD